MARVCDSCDKRFDPSEAVIVKGEIPRFGISGDAFKVQFEITHFPWDDDDDEEPDVCPKCVITSIRDSIEKWPPR